MKKDSNGFRTFGYSLNVDYKPVENVVIRLEGKRLSSQDQPFEKAELQPAGHFTVFTAALAISF